MLRPSRSKSKVILSKHYLGTLTTGPGDQRLRDGLACKTYIDSILVYLGVTSLGDMLYPFPNKSFSLIINLAESHISIHTWPERNAVQLDVFLCNYRRDNSETGRQIYNKIVEYFQPVHTDTSVIKRR